MSISHSSGRREWRALGPVAPPAAITVVLQRSALVFAACLMASCGLTTRMMVGPTVDIDGRIGVAVAVTQGMLIGGTPRIAPTVTLGAGSRDNDLGLSATGGVEAVWRVAGTTTRPDESLPPPGSLRSWGVRGGVRVGVERLAGESDLIGGLVAAVVFPVGYVRAAALSLGAEAGCHAAMDPDAAPGVCSLGLAVELNNSPPRPAHVY
jgi:hypothetical protein